VLKLVKVRAMPVSLEGCIWSPSKYPGLAKLDVFTKEHADALTKLPGHLAHINGKQELTELHIPRNLIEMGRKPGTLYEYDQDQIEQAPSGLKLKEHQLRSVAFLRLADQGAILGADPGLGKCVMSLQALWLDGYLHKPGIIVGPMGARSAWCGQQSDALIHYQLPVQPLTGTTPDPAALQGYNWFFIHHEILHYWKDLLWNFRPTSVIIDESHFLMNLSAKRTKDAFELIKGAFIERRYLLTGTPIPKTRMDLWSQLAMAQPNQWGVHPHDFGMRYAAGHRQSYEEGKGHFVYEGVSNTTELRARLCGIYLRYTKADVPGELPELKRRGIALRGKIDLSRYWDAQVNVGKYLKKKEEAPDALEFCGMKVSLPKDEKSRPKAVQLTSLTTLISLLEEAKQEACIAEVLKLTGEFDKIVVFTWRRAVAKYIAEQLRKYATPTYPADLIIGPISGAQQEVKRREKAEQFAKMDKGLFVCTRGATGVAMNELQTAEVCLQVSPAWNPEGNIQTESRVHREGNPHKVVHSIYFYCPGTVDDLFMDKLYTKAQEAHAIAPNDSEGMRLVADLVPDGAGGRGDDLDEICAVLAEMENDDE
jgi:hypothetical protein